MQINPDEITNILKSRIEGLDSGRAELTRITAITGDTSVGIRMHWLLSDARTASTLEHAGYSYDTTAGYNETLGYRPRPGFISYLKRVSK